jgi:hypothetical protein
MGKRLWVRDDNERAVRGVFKWATSKAKRYAIGTERLIYHLADLLGLPVPPTYLDSCEGREGSVQIFVPGPAWKHAAASVPWVLKMAENEDLWPLMIAFDIWVAHPDRHDRNIIIRPEPPDRRIAACAGCSLWLVDNGRSALWTPAKFAPGLATVDRITVAPDGGMRAEIELQIRESMPEPYRQAYEQLSRPDRDQLLDRIRALSDNALEDAVREIPSQYYSSREADLTIQLLVARRDALGTLSDGVFP